MVATFAPILSSQKRSSSADQAADDEEHEKHEHEHEHEHEDPCQTNSNPAKKYRKTPPPFQSIVSNQDDDKDEKFGRNLRFGDLVLTDSCVLDSASPELCEDVKQNLDVEVPVVPNENVDVDVNEDSEWKRWVERVVGTKLHDASATLSATNREGHKGHGIPNLSAYLTAKTALQIAEKKFESSLEECLGGLTKAMTEEMVSHSIGKVYEEQGERFETLERDFFKTVASNHKRRNALLAKIEQANEDWKSCYKAIRASVMNQTNPIREARETPNFLGEDSNDDTNTVPAIGGMQDQRDDAHIEEGKTDPNWDEIAQSFEASRDTIRSFVDAREKLRQADVLLKHNLDEIHCGLKNDADAIAQIAIDFYEQHKSKSWTLEQNIESHIMSNHQRRQTYQTSLQESARKAQGFFANLLSRLTNSSQN